MLSKTITLLTLVLVGGWVVFLTPHENIPIHEDDLNQKILGRWISEIDNKSQWVFLPDGVLKPFYDGEEMSERTWEFTHECNGAQVQEDDYGILKIMSFGDFHNCYVVQGLESVLTLLRIPEGNLLIFDRVVE